MSDAVFTTREVATITGASLRQLQWWDERGILQPSEWGRGCRPNRLYTFDQVNQVRRLLVLTRAGVPISHAARFLASEWHEVIVVHEPTVVGGVLVVHRARTKPRGKAAAPTGRTYRAAYPIPPAEGDTGA